MRRRIPSLERHQVVPDRSAWRRGGRHRSKVVPPLVASLLETIGSTIDPMAVLNEHSGAVGAGRALLECCRTR